MFVAWTAHKRYDRSAPDTFGQLYKDVTGGHISEFSVAAGLGWTRSVPPPRSRASAAPNHGAKMWHLHTQLRVLEGPEPDTGPSSTWK